MSAFRTHWVEPRPLLAFLGFAYINGMVIFSTQLPHEFSLMHNDCSKLTQGQFSKFSQSGSQFSVYLIPLLTKCFT
ncbi:hypothetical protein M422DRAFT_277275 [Sphaerobolus stellatus SS14]|uniref:Uncharacterized protein n=1 Tax=Sphaerobolus stellatus (strain SS14) TaxID=990650 RepID=A0A0C9T0U2_SPHS4|nr:hypothetical protein M422DRAFT_277275 [Sphaerobolus stellatus SS14]